MENMPIIHANVPIVH